MYHPFVKYTSQKDPSLLQNSAVHIKSAGIEWLIMTQQTERNTSVLTHIVTSGLEFLIGVSGTILEAVSLIFECVVTSLMFQ